VTVSGVRDRGVVIGMEGGGVGVAAADEEAAIEADGGAAADVLDATGGATGEDRREAQPSLPRN
jgi:hypothetical protein